MENNDELGISDLIKDMYPNKDFYYIEDFDDAIIGISKNKLVYSKKCIIDILMDTMTPENAVKYYNENVENGYYGEKTPIFVDDDIQFYIYTEDNLFDRIKPSPN